ncbi:non-ribosomal peptide synthetase [Actinoplanes sp. Pm04-4]|uniref:Non-ribosomal peptide synthetase n=1 Tax=Paractinoplanes pyxinae TaxID=2997416 RepID=A0ABT4BC26_9ACTN|nr:non-ribosomal peptide synthetase [Actinoplanes pyxinae]MCY1144079.1 non-ribosomal peptide synthetase [Actinoplanes pyxinae]
MDSPPQVETVLDLLAKKRTSSTTTLLGPNSCMAGLEIYALTLNVSAALVENGIGARSRIGLVCGTGIETAVALLAITTVGVCVPINPTVPVDEIGRYLDSMGVHTVVVTDDTAGSIDESLARLGKRCLRISVSRESRVDPEAALELIGGAPEPDDVCLLLATSGTTSKPKIVPLTHRNLTTSARNISRTLLLSPEDRGLLVMPLFHIHGLVAGLLAPLYAEGSIYLLPNQQPADILAALEKSAITWYSAVPTIHYAVADMAASRPALRHGLRFVRSSSAPLAPTLMARLEEFLGVPVIEAYGMTEASHQMASNALTGSRIAGSVGKPAGVEIRVVDSAGVAKPAGEVGEIVIRGDSVTAGYLDNAEANSSAFIESWLRTGDQGFFDEGGFLHLSGRTKEIINRGGEKVFPREVDDVLMRHPAVAQALTFSIRHPRLGEDVGAAIVVNPGAHVNTGELQIFVSNYLAPFKVPRRIVVVPELPKGPTGKPQRVGMEDRVNGSADVRLAQRDAGKNELEDSVIAEWRQILDIAEISPMDDFFHLGGDSIQAVRLIGKVEERFGVTLPIASIFTSASFPRGMSHAIAEMQRPDIATPVF